LLYTLWLGRGNLYIYSFFFLLLSSVSVILTWVLLLCWVKLLRIFLLLLRLHAVRRFGPKGPVTCRSSFFMLVKHSVLCDVTLKCN
jgi:hypothetical protein